MSLFIGGDTGIARLLRSGVLEVNFCARPRSAEP